MITTRMTISFEKCQESLPSKKKIKKARHVVDVVAIVVRFPVVRIEVGVVLVPEQKSTTCKYNCSPKCWNFGYPS